MIRIGTAGFSYKDWEGPVYPAPTPRDFDRLAYLAGFFDCIEMNVTFYRVPESKSVARWVESVGTDFRFTFKVYRGLTHGDEDDQLGPFLEGLAPCRDAGKLGALLLQFPFFFRNTQDNRARLAFLANGLRGWPTAVEVRDRSWLAPPARDFLARLGLGLCAIDICQARDSVPPGPLRAGPLGYVRLHGRNADAWFDRKASVNDKYNYLYSPAELDQWAGWIREIAAETESTYVITNNHFAGKAVANAFQLARMLRGDAPEPPPQLVREYPELA